MTRLSTVRIRIALAALGVAAVGAVVLPHALRDDAPVVATVVALAVVVVAAALGGLVVGLAVAAAAWAFSFAFVADTSGRALAALPAWLAVGAVAGWLADRLRRSEAQAAD